MTQGKFKAYDGKEMHYYLFKPQNPKAVVQIIHGMQEHAGRYMEFAKYLEQNGFIVFASDLRGHGKTTESLPGYSDGDIFEENVKTQIEITKYLKDKYKLPVYVFGHSYGSFITQNYLTKENVADKAILSGSAYTKTALFKIAKYISKITSSFKGRKANAKLIEKLSLKGYGKKFENGNWLSRDDEVIEKYNSDEFCGKAFPASFYESMFKGTLKNYENIEKINIPVFLIAGSSDPVGSQGKLVKKLYNTYKKAGVNAEIKLYEDARHEVLNETNKQEVYKDILDFYEK